MKIYKYTHTNIVTHSWRRLARFYVNAFGCERSGPLRNLSGISVENGTRVEGARIKGIHLRLPGYSKDGPTLEIFQYSSPTSGSAKFANSQGFAHIAFEVQDIDIACSGIIKAGGSMLGKLACQFVAGVGHCTFIYVRDPDGNIIEIQTWKNNDA